jgi:hypothetical protein
VGPPLTEVLDPSFGRWYGVHVSGKLNYLHFHIIVLGQ